VAAIDAGVLAVFGIVALAFVLFATEPVPVDVTALLVMVLLMVPGPWTKITPREGISGFANPATVTVFAMLTLSVGVSKTGAVQNSALSWPTSRTATSEAARGDHCRLPGSAGKTLPRGRTKRLLVFRGNYRSWGRGVAWYPCGLGCR